MELIDNINKTLKGDFVTELRSGSKVAIAASCFSIYAFEELKAQLKDIDELRFIFTSPTFVTEKANKQKREFYIPRLNRERNLYGSESHNFRNGGKVTTDESDDNPRENRYLQLMNRVIRSGVKTKVLMLSATPVNNRFNDLKNQIQLAYEGESEKIDELLNTSSSIDDIFRQAQKEYNIWAKLPAEERTTKELLNRLSFDFFEVLDSVTIARSRKHIEQYYDTADIGKFPTRLTPIPRRPDLTDLDSAINYNEIYEILSRLNLAIYTPSDFILASRVEKYIDTDSDGGYFAGRGMAGREKGIRRLMSINLLKRLESSVNSFRLTLERIKSLISSTIEKLNTIEQSENFELELENISQNLDYDDREADMFIGGKKTKFPQWCTRLALHRRNTGIGRL